MARSSVSQRPSPRENNFATKDRKDHKRKDSLCSEICQNHSFSGRFGRGMLGRGMGKRQCLEIIPLPIIPLPPPAFPSSICLLAPAQSRWASCAFWRLRLCIPSCAPLSKAAAIPVVLAKTSHGKAVVHLAAHVMMPESSKNEAKAAERR